MLRRKSFITNLFNDQSQADKKPLLNKLVISLANADWDQIEAILSKNPESMFDNIEMKVHGMNLTTSVVEYACFVRDRYTLNICAKHLREEQRSQFKEILNAHIPDRKIFISDEESFVEGAMKFLSLVDKWLTNKTTINDLRTYLLDQTKQLSTHTYSLEPFYWVYEITQILYDQTSHNINIPMSKVQEFWLHMDGFAKENLLPRHMLKEMQAKDPGFSWKVGGLLNDKNDSKFDSANYPNFCETDMSVFAKFDKDQPVLGEHYSILRGSPVHKRDEQRGARAVMEIYNEPLFIIFNMGDYKLFRLLDETRRSDIIKFCDALVIKNDDIIPKIKK